MVTIRNAEPDDARAIAAVHVRAWQAAYRGLIDDGFLARLRPEDWEPRHRVEAGGEGPEGIVAMDGDAVAGFATFGPSRDADAAEAGEIRALYVDPSRWRRHVGGLLLEEAKRRLRARGHAEAILWVLVGNEGAERFYRSDGWHPDGARRQEHPYGVVSNVIRYRRRLD